MGVVLEFGRAGLLLTISLGSSEDNPVMPFVLNLQGLRCCNGEYREKSFTPKRA